MGFGLVIGFIELLQIVTTSKYSAVINSHTLQFTIAHTKSSQSAVSSPVDVPLLLGSRPCGMAAISYQLPTLLTAVSILPCNESESESYVTTDSQSASLSWYKAPIWAYDQIFIAVRDTEYVGQLWVC
jgi:hypothetical protein